MLMSSLNSKDGNSVTVEDLAAGIQAWSRKRQENEEQQSSPGISWSGGKYRDKYLSKVQRCDNECSLLTACNIIRYCMFMFRKLECRM